MQSNSSDDLWVIDQNKTALLDLPQATKDFLNSRSQAVDWPLYVSFTTESGTFPTLNDFCKAHDLPTVPDGDRLYRIGTDEGGQLCLKAGEGAVVLVDPTRRHEQRFVNKNFECFIAFLELYQLYASAVQGMPEDEAVSFVEQTARNMRDKDESALCDPDSWWSSVVQQMEFGML